MARIALCAVIIAVCSWISIPGPVPFTMQTFGIFFALAFLGGKYGTVAVTVYLLLGAVGVPVFSGFSGGIAKLLGVTGGYLIGFIPAALIYWLITSKDPENIRKQAFAVVSGLLSCYAFGTAWYTIVYTTTKAPIGFFAALMNCVVPFVIPDAVKIILALGLAKRLKKYIK